MVFRYRVDSETEPAINRGPTRFVEVLLARLTREDFRRNERGELGTRTASPNRSGMQKLRSNWIYRTSWLSIFGSERVGIEPFATSM